MCKLNSKIFVQVAGVKGHRRRYGKQRRVLLGGMTVDEATKRQRNQWEKVTHSAGILEDQLIEFAKKNGFRPTKRIDKWNGVFPTTLLGGSTNGVSMFLPQPK
jgi:hypothetical protein